MADSDFLELVKRVAASLDAALIPIEGRFKAYRYYPYAPNHLPYALVYFGARTPREGAFGSEVDDHIQTLSVLFVLAHVTEGAEGEYSEKMYQTFLPALYDHFYETHWLTSPTYPLYPDWLSPREVKMLHGGWQRFQNSTISGDQVGMLFTLTLPIVFQKGN